MFVKKESAIRALKLLIANVHRNQPNRDFVIRDLKSLAVSLNMNHSALQREMESDFFFNLTEKEKEELLKKADNKITEPCLDFISCYYVFIKQTKFNSEFIEFIIDKNDHKTLNDVMKLIAKNDITDFSIEDYKLNKKDEVFLAKTKLKINALQHFKKGL